MPQNSKAFVRLPYSPRFTSARRLFEGDFGTSILKEEGKHFLCHVLWLPQYQIIDYKRKKLKPCAPNGLFSIFM